MCPESVQLAVVVEARALQRRHHDRGRACPARSKRDRRTGPVVVLDESDQALLIGGVGQEMAA
jgi:hypothetical protein